MKVYFNSGSDAGQVIDKHPDIARRLITIGMCRLPTAAELEAAAPPPEVKKPAAKSKKSAKGSK